MTTAAVLLLAACATTSTPRPGGALPPSGPVASGEDGSRRWTPGPGAERALEEVWAAKPFGASPAALSQAGKGAVPRTHETEVLLFEEHDRVEESGRAVSVIRSVFRYLKESPDRTLTFRWAPWREEKPVVKARVISAAGEESWLDTATAVEGVPSVNGLELTDVKAIGLPLPNARLGSVIELSITRVTTRPLVPGGGELRSARLWSFAPVRKLRLSAEVPASVPLVIDAVGIPAPEVTRHGSTQGFSVEIGELDFKPLKLTRKQMAEQTPRLVWSTGKGWEDIAARYREQIAETFNDTVDFSSLAPLAAGADTPTRKVQAVLRWIAEHVRYTAIHLGDGAILPTRPSKTLARGYGDCKDLAVLTTLALRSLGLRAEVATLSADDDLPSEKAAGLAAFNHMIVAVADDTAANGKTIWVDATAPKFPAGVVPMGDRNQRALIIAPGTRGLSPTPRNDETAFTIRQRFDLQFSPFDSGKAKVTLENGGAAEAILRSSIDACDETTARKLAEGPMGNLFGEVPFTAQLGNCAVGSGPLTVTAQLDRAERLGTGDLSASVRLVSRVLDAVVDDALRGQEPGSDQRTSEMKAETQRRLQEELGITEDDFYQRAYSFDSRPDIERVYHIKAPARFAAQKLPPGRTIEMGPARFIESYREIDASTVEVKFRFESAQTDLSPDDVKKFREAYWKRWSEPATEITFVFEPLKLIDERKPEAAVALLKKWSQEAAGDGVTRARVASMLLRLGIGDLARSEAERAVKDAPDSTVVLAIRGNIARYDDKVRLYQKPWERAVAVDMLRKAFTRAPTHDWLARTLADVLRRNEAGEVDRAFTRDAAEGAAMLEKLIDMKEAGNSAVQQLLDIYVGGRQLDRLAKLVEKHPEIREGDESGTVDALLGGADAVLRRLERIQDPKERLKRVSRAYEQLAEAGRYDEADALLERYDPGPTLSTEYGTLVNYAKDVKEAPAAADLSTPEKAARSLSAILRHASSWSEAANKLAQLASTAGKAEVGVGSRLFHYVRLPDAVGSETWDHLYYRGQCQVSGTSALARVRCQSPEYRKLALTSYWVTEGGKLKLESIGKPSQAAARAWALASEKKSPEAAQSAGQWIDWLIEELQARENRSISSSLLQDLWSQPGSHSGEGLQLAAAMTWFVFGDATREAPQAAVDALKNGRARLSGALRRRADETLSMIYDVRGDLPDAIKALEPLATSENEPRLWRHLTTLEYQAGRMAKAMERTLSSLKADPANVEWRQIKALIEMRSGKYDACIETLQQLNKDKGDTVDNRNNLAWAKFMAGKVTEEVEREVLQIANDKDTGENELHTAAMVLLDRGRLTAAADANGRRKAALDDDKDEATWLFRARLLQLLGYDEAAKAAWAHVVKDAEFLDYKKRVTGKAMAHR